MLETKSIFNDRCTEIEAYISFIKSIELNKVALVTCSSTKPKIENFGSQNFLKVDPSFIPKIIDTEIKKILKANSYLLLYNLVESTVRNTVEAIYKNLKDKGVSLDDITGDLKVEVLNNLKKHVSKIDAKQFSEQISSISKDIVHMTFDSKKSFNGNVDAKVIREQVKRLGFQVICARDSRNGSDLLSIKSKRNLLAHGEISFCECGRELVVSELEEIAQRTRDYLLSFIECTEKYLLKFDDKKK